MSPVSTTHADAHHADHGHHPTGIWRYLYSTNHKDIGTMYLVFAVVAGCIGGLFSIFMRAELMEPGIQLGMFGNDGDPNQQRRDHPANREQDEPRRERHHQRFHATPSGKFCPHSFYRP